MWVLLRGLGAWLLGGLIAIAPTLVGQVLIALGISVVTYTGVDAALGWLQTQAVNSLTGLGPTIVGLLALMKVGTCISMLTSAVLARATLTGLTSGTMKSWVKK